MNSPVFILSTGRTGTQFFENYINQTSDEALCKHEPKPSRRFKFLSNLYLNNHVSESTIINIYKYSRKNLLKKTDNKLYIESSNFMFGCIPALNQYFPNIKIVHIVRHPVTYIESHLNHGFWNGHKKFFAKYIPFWLEKMNIKDISDPVNILTERWNYVNKQIESYTQTNDYLFIRFEDLFSKDNHLSSVQLNTIREFCGIPLLREQENHQWVGKPKNFSSQKYHLSISDKEFILTHNKELMKEYSYHE
jgi:hypothetical protein